MFKAIYLYTADAPEVSEIEVRLQATTLNEAKSEAIIKLQIAPTVLTLLRVISA